MKSVPGSRALLTRPPAQVELCFNEDVELKFSSVRLLAPGGEPVPLGELGFGPSGRRCIAAPVPALDEVGTYTVHYRVLSQDGHVVEYGYAFDLQPPD